MSYKYRPIKQIDLDGFRRGILESHLYDATVSESSSASDYAVLFDNEVTRLLDVYAPVRSVTKRQGAHDVRQLSDEARAAKRNCRRLERRFRKTQADADRKEFKCARDLARLKIEESRTNSITVKVSASAGDPRQMWRTTKQLLQQSVEHAE